MAFSRSRRRLACVWSYSQLLLKSRTLLSRFSILAPMSGNSNGSSVNSTHLERTENSARQETVAQATITEISQLSETVKRLRIKVEDKRFTFKPGQWVDFFIPGMSTVGGFSFCSSPKELQEQHTVELAVKQNEHPPALWIHTKCRVGSEVQMRVGGSFYFDPKPGDPCPDLLLIAGGVGINPLYSIVRHVADIASDSRHEYTGRTALLFSAKNMNELLFKDSLVEISRRCPSIRCKFFTTKPENSNHGLTADEIQIHRGRINESSLQEAISSLDRSQLTCYICGPPPMIKHVTDILRKLNIAETRIHFEKWW